MVFEQKSRLGKTTRGICVGEAGNTLTLHINAKSTVEADIVNLIRTETTSAQQSVAGRFYRAADLLANGTIKAKWDSSFLTTTAWSAATQNTSSMRATFDDCISAGWTSIADAIQLTPTEKSWRRAHSAAADNDVTAVAFHLQDLPDVGYPARAGLLLPFVERILLGDRSDWIELVSRWDSSVPGRDLLLGLFSEEPVSAETAPALARVAAPALPVSVAQTWLSAIEDISVERLPDPPSPTLGRWLAYRWITDSEASPPAAADLALLPTTLLDDAVDAGRLTSATSLTALDTETANYLTARLDAGSLDISALRALGHDAELARRLFLNKGATELSGLSVENPKVRHYQALLKLITTGELETEHLLGDGHEALDAASRERELIAKGELTEVSDAVAADPSLWSVFSELALAGKLEASSTQRLAHPDYAEWLDLHRVLERLWSGELREAADLAGRMADQLKDEILRDEALNMQAFAHAALGSPTIALRCLEDAMEGEYTQSLLINTAIIAAEAEQSVATTYLNKLIVEAPSLDLQVAAMDRAVQLWLGSPDLELDPETAHCLYHLILEPSLSPAHYVPFLRLASKYDSARIASQPPPTPAEPEKLAAWQVFCPLARMRNGEIRHADYIDEVIRTSKQFRDFEWLDALRESEIESVRQGLFEDLGEGAGAAISADRFLQDGAEFLARHVYFFYSTRTALHLAAMFQEQDGALSDDAANRLLFVPAEEFLVEASEMPPDLVDVLHDQFYRAFSIYASIKHDEHMPENQFLIERYNTLAGRVNWDYENRRSIIQDMNRILARQQEMIDDIKRIADRVPRFRPMDLPQGERPLVDRINDGLREWQAEIIRLRSNL